MKYEKIGGLLFESVKYVEAVYNYKFYEETRFWNCTFSNCIWESCKFYRILFSKNTLFENCKFLNCKFYGAHTYVGGPTLFKNCRFELCSIKDIQFWDTTFINAYFSGEMTNIVFYGPLAPKGWETVLKGVDLSKCNLSVVDFRSGIDLSEVTLPK